MARTKGMGITKAADKFGALVVGSGEKRSEEVRELACEIVDFATASTSALPSSVETRLQDALYVLDVEYDEAEAEEADVSRRVNAVKERQLVHTAVAFAQMRRDGASASGGYGFAKEIVLCAARTAHPPRAVMNVLPAAIAVVKHHLEEEVDAVEEANIQDEENDHGASLAPCTTFFGQDVWDSALSLAKTRRMAMAEREFEMEFGARHLVLARAALSAWTKAVAAVRTTTATTAAAATDDEVAGDDSDDEVQVVEPAAKRFKNDEADEADEAECICATG